MTSQKRNKINKRINNKSRKSQLTQLDLYNFPNDYPINEYGFGSALKNAFSGAFNQGGLNSIANAGIGSLGSTIGKIGGDLIAGGKSSGVGNAISNIGGTLGSAIGTANPVAGAVVGAASGVLGGAFNAIGGVKLNKERIAQAENEINAVKNFNADASNFDDLVSQINNAPIITAFSQKDIGSNSLFNKGATKEYNRLDNMKNFAEAWKENSIANAATNLQQQQMNTLLQNSAAYGGLLDMNNQYSDGGPLSSLVKDINERSNADFVQRLLDPNRDYIQDWESDNIATHKLGWATDDKGAIVFPNVQRINGKLYDFTDPKNKRGKWDALDSAIQRGDTLRMSPSQAKEFTENYKKYYPKGATFKAFGGDLLTSPIYTPNYNQGEVYDIDESELELLKRLGYEYEIVE